LGFFPAAKEKKQKIKTEQEDEELADDPPPLSTRTNNHIINTKVVEKLQTQIPISQTSNFKQFE
jgi:hypothetical protein